MISQTLQIAEADDMCKYFGLPNIPGINKSAILDFPKENVNKKICNWDVKPFRRLVKMC